MLFIYLQQGGFMKITNACEQYFNAYQELSNWKNNDKWTNLGLAIEVLSYFTIVAPLIVVATYATINLTGRITSKDELSDLDFKISSTFKKHNTKSFFCTRMLSLNDLSKLNPTDPKKALQELNLRNLNAFIDTLGGVDNFLEKLKKADPNILTLVSLLDAESDPITLKYALLSESEVGALPLKELSLPMQELHATILKAQLDKLPKTDHDELSPVDEISTLTLSTVNSVALTKDQIDNLINSYGELIIRFMPEKQIQDFIINNEKMNNLSPKLYNALFASLDEAVNKMRFSFLSEYRVNEIMLKFTGKPVDLLSKEQEKHFFSKLEAKDVDINLYGTLFHSGYTKGAARFKLIPNEEATKFMLKLKGNPVRLLSKEQENHFFSKLEAKDIGSNLYDTLFSSGYIEGAARFKLIPNEEATKFMVSFKGKPVDLLSKEQEKHFFSKLEAKDVDSNLYDRVFLYDYTKGTARFQLIPNEEATKLMLRFKGKPVDLLSKEQEKHFFSKLEAKDVDSNLYDRVFLYDYTKGTARFQLIPNEEAAKFMLRFKGEPVDLLSKEQEKHFFSNLEAKDVDSNLYRTLFRYSYTKGAARFQLIPNEEATKLMLTFKGEPLDLLSKEQENHFFSKLEAKDVDGNLYRTLFSSSGTKGAARFQLIPNEEATKLMLTFKGEPLDLLSKEQENHFFSKLEAKDVDGNLYRTLFSSSGTKGAARFQLLSPGVQNLILNKFIHF